MLNHYYHSLIILEDSIVLAELNLLNVLSLRFNIIMSTRIIKQLLTDLIYDYKLM